MNSLTIVMTVMGTGLGLCIGWLLAYSRGRRDERVLTAQQWEPPTSELLDEDYRRRWARDDEDDHPADIERQGSHLVPAPSGARFQSDRPYDERYDGLEARRILD